MELIPLEAARIEISPGDLTCLAQDVSVKFSLSAEPTSDDHWQHADDALAYARDFYRACLGRSAHMATQTLKFVRGRGYDRAMLVVGGFHPEAISHEFEADRRVSFSVVSPASSL